MPSPNKVHTGRNVSISTDSTGNPIVEVERERRYRRTPNAAVWREGKQPTAGEEATTRGEGWQRPSYDRTPEKLEEPEGDNGYENNEAEEALQYQADRQDQSLGGQETQGQATGETKVRVGAYLHRAAA